MDLTAFTSLPSDQYRHPLETKAMENLKNTRGFQKLVNKFHEVGLEQNIRHQYRASSIKVTTNNLRHLIYLADKAAETLGLDKTPEIFINRSDQLQGLSIGIQHPMIILSSKAVDKLPNQELLFIIGREMAHIDHQHTLYKEIGLIFPDLIDAFSVVTLGLSTLVSAGMKYALNTWDLYSEYTADRGGLVACQDTDASLALLAKMAGWPERHWASINIPEFRMQALSLEEGPSKAVDKIIDYMLGSNAHSIGRAKELVAWIDNGFCDQLISATDEK